MAKKKNKKKGKYDATLNLPQTEFPMRGNLPVREPEMVKYWEEIDVYQQVQDKNQGKDKFVLHDGPPFANGDIHLGHTLNKVLKDIIIKYKSMRGLDAPYVPGWDTHGLPIETQAIKDLGIDRRRTDIMEFRQYCHDYALKYVDIQRDQFKRLGIRGDWEHPYLTLSPEFESVQIKVFGEMAKKGYIYKGVKPVYWCADCETALAEAEIEYGDRVSPSIYVKFSVADGKGILPQDAYVVIWTTTPWTLPANLAISVHPDFEYVLLEHNNEKYLVARGLLEELQGKLGWENITILQQMKGQELEGVLCQHPFIDRESKIICGEHVTLEAGTGCVHTAPGHGEDDYYVGLEYGLPILSPVDSTGHFTKDAGQFTGLFVHDANNAIIQELQEKGMLLKAEDYEHQYPFCWRCKEPIIYRATDQWFTSVDGFRQSALDAIDDVKWIPSWGRDRIYNMVAERGDWCISRQRSWGVPLPIFYCHECEETIMNEETIDHISELFAEHGSSIWFTKEAHELLPEGYSCPNCGAQSFEKETDIMDVWFDSGSSHMAVLETYPELSWPADMYLEGSDQHRGWFNSSLSTAVAVKGKAPYRSVLTHGFVVDENGHKMSKSQGNVIDPLKLIDKMGADILRLWVSSADYRNDIAVSSNIIKQTSESYRKIRNTCRFILGNLYDFDPDHNSVAYEELSDFDRWALLRLEALVRRVTEAYDEYEFHTVFHAIHNFCTIDMSSIYFDVLKDTLYCTHPQDKERRAVQTVLYEVIQTITIMLAPIMAFTTEEIWSHLRKEDQPESIQLLDWPSFKEDYRDSELEAHMEKILQVREVVSKALEAARVEKVIGHSLGADVIIYADGEWLDVLGKTKALNKLFIVSHVELRDTDFPADAVSLETVPGVAVTVQPAKGDKCQRCWVIDESVGQDTEYVELCDRCVDVVKKLEG